MQSAQIALSAFPTPREHLAPLSDALTGHLKFAAASDATWSYRSSIMSIVSALSALEAGYRSWPAVHLYYSAFYSIRSILLANDICLYFCNQKPMKLHSVVGAYAEQLTFKGASSSHGAAFRVFADHFPGHPLNGEIDFLPALHWLKKARESVNYNEAEMNIDDRLQLFTRYDRYGLRSTIGTYLENPSLYAFLPDEAVLAYPLYAAQQALKSLNPSAASNLPDLIAQTIERVRDRTGPVGTFSQYQLNDS